MPGEKLVLKMWETIAEKGIACLFKPWQMRREGYASLELKRAELLVIAQAEQDVERIRRGELQLSIEANPQLLLEDMPQHQTAQETTQNLSLLAVASDITIAETIQRESNLTRALLYAENSLEQDPQTPPETNVDTDWVYRWRDNASQVSSEELQSLWGQVLAGEVKCPGSYSLRTLDFLKNLSQKEAEAIALLSRFVVGGSIFREANELLAEEGVDFGFLLKMQQLGIVAGVEAIGLTVTWGSVDTSRFVRPLKSNRMVLIASGDDPTLKISLPVYQLTFIGEEVLRLGKFEPHIEYLERVGARLKAQGVKVELAHYFDIDSNQIHYFSAREL